jgi:uncharacterized protein (DUF3084 family)
MEIELVVIINMIMTSILGIFQVIGNRPKISSEARKSDAQAHKLSVQAVNDLANSLSVAMGRSLEQNQISIDLINAREVKNDELRNEVFELKKNMLALTSKHAAEMDKLKLQIEDQARAGIAKAEQIAILEEKNRNLEAHVNGLEESKRSLEKEVADLKKSSNDKIELLRGRIRALETERDELSKKLREKNGKDVKSLGKTEKSAEEIPTITPDDGK